MDPDWITVQDMLLKLALDSLTVFNLDSMQHEVLIAIAEKQYGSVATANARSMLKLVYNEEYFDEIPGSGSGRYMYTNSNIQSESLDVSLKPVFTLTPNPANDLVMVEMNLSVIDNSKCVLRILDNSGRVVFKNDFFKSEAHITIPVSQLDMGVYSI